jgi:membrane protein DedA with SNARE-associated domain
MIDTLRMLVENYGYVAVAIGCFFEGETAVILGILASQHGYLIFQNVLIAGFVGTVIGDNFWFHLGRKMGEPLLQRNADWRAKAERVEKLMERYGAPVMIGFRFLYGLRSITPFMLGAARISPWRFLMYEATGALLWTSLVGAIGFYLGAAVERVIARIHSLEQALAIVVVMIVFAVWASYSWRARARRQQQLENAEKKLD